VNLATNAKIIRPERAVVGASSTGGWTRTGRRPRSAPRRAVGSAAAAPIGPDGVPDRWLLDPWAANRFVLRETLQ